MRSATPRPAIVGTSPAPARTTRSRTWRAHPPGWRGWQSGSARQSTARQILRAARSWDRPCGQSMDSCRSRSQQHKAPTTTHVCRRIAPLSQAVVYRTPRSHWCASMPMRVAAKERVDPRCRGLVWLSSPTAAPRATNHPSWDGRWAACPSGGLKKRGPRLPGGTVQWHTTPPTTCWEARRSPRAKCLWKTLEPPYRA